MGYARKSYLRRTSGKLQNHSYPEAPMKRQVHQPCSSLWFSALPLRDSKEQHHSHNVRALVSKLFLASGSTHTNKIRGVRAITSSSECRRYPLRKNTHQISCTRLRTPVLKKYCLNAFDSFLAHMQRAIWAFDMPEQTNEATSFSRRVSWLNGLIRQQFNHQKVWCTIKMDIKPNGGWSQAWRASVNA